MRYLSPLRYPGGKASFTAFLEDVIDLNDLRGADYYEPYAGGCGAALKLLEKGVVGNVYINDADLRVYAFWKSVLKNPVRFADLILTIPLNLDEWRRQQSICASPAQYDEFEVGFSAFYMNRCNRSGVLSGAGPIGGLEQSGKWKLNVRFPREELAERILQVGRLRKAIHVYGSDAIKFLKSSLPYGQGRRNVFVYLDPPYVNKGQRLYLNSYQKQDHAGIAKYVSSQRILPWLMSYDESALIRSLYSKQNLFVLPVRYSLQQKRAASELVICPNYLTLPRSIQIQGMCAPLSQSEIVS